MLRQIASSAGVIAVRMLYVILTAGIGLSVGSIAAPGGVLSLMNLGASGATIRKSKWAS